MKKERKRHSLTFLIILVCVLLTACQQPITTGAWTGWQMRAGASSDTGYYYLKDYSFLHYFDFESGVSVCLCSKIGCHHNGTDCESYLEGTSGVSPMFLWNDYLYYTERDAYGIQLIKRKADGSGIEHVASLCQPYVEEKKEIHLFLWVAVDGLMYYGAEIFQIVHQGGVAASQRQLNLLCCIDLQTGKDQTLVKNADAQLELCAASTNGMLYIERYTPADHTASDYRQQLNNSKVLLRQWDRETGESKTLFEKVHKDCRSQVGFADNKLYYTFSTDENYSNFTAYDLNTGKETLISHANLTFINENYALRYDDTAKRKYIYDLKAGKDLPTDFENNSLSVERVFSNGLILRIGEYAPGSTTSIASVTNCYVPMEALKDGLQISDLKIIYTRK